jgi:hypothetical protein
MNSDFLMSLSHFAFAVLSGIYGFIFPKSWVDYFFIFYLFAVTISWSSLNGECVVTYLAKCKTDINYIPGKNVKNNDDFYIFPGVSDQTINMILNILMIGWIIGIYIVFKRNDYPEIIAVSFMTVCLIYKFLLMTYENHHENAEFHLYQKFVLCALIFLLFATLYHTKIWNVEAHAV